MTGLPVLCIWDAQVRRHFQDCHHRHDERSNGGKKKFSDETTVFDPMFQQISREEELLSLHYRSRGSKETRVRGTKRRKQDAEASG